MRQSNRSGSYLAATQIGGPQQQLEAAFAPPHILPAQQHPVSASAIVALRKTSAQSDRCSSSRINVWKRRRARDARVGAAQARQEESLRSSARRSSARRLKEPGEERAGMMPNLVVATCSESGLEGAKGGGEAVMCNDSSSAHEAPWMPARSLLGQPLDLLPSPGRARCFLPNCISATFVCCLH